MLLSIYTISRSNLGTSCKADGLIYGPPYRTEDSPSHPPPEVITRDMVTVELQTEEPRDVDEVIIDVIDDQPVIKQHQGDNKLGFESQVPEDLDMSESDYDDDFSSSDVENGLRYSTRASSTTGRRSTTTVSPTTSSTPSTTIATTFAGKTEVQTTFEMATYLTSETMTSNPRTTTTDQMTTIAVTTEPPPKYFWRITAKMPCSATCGRGKILFFSFYSPFQMCFLFQPAHRLNFDSGMITSVSCLQRCLFIYITP